MKDYEHIREAVKHKLSPSRFEHTLNVEREAERLAVKYGADIHRCKIAALIHDMSKELSDYEILMESEKLGLKIDIIQRHDPQLLHGPLASEKAKIEFDIEDNEVLSAAAYHTTGRMNMSLVEKIIYLADMIEEGRRFHGVEELRKTAYINFDKALYVSCNSTLDYIMGKNLLIHPLTVEFRNDLLLKGGIEFGN